MTKNRIDALIDDHNTSYAYAWLEKSHGYGHMIIQINMVKTGEYSYRRPDGVIKISCQIGGEGDRCSRTYAERYGFDARMGDGTLNELEAAVTIMRKIERYMRKMYEENGSAPSYANYCQRVLNGAGVKHLILSPFHWSQGGNKRDMDLVSVGSSSAHRLDLMEKELLCVFQPKAA